MRMLVAGALLSMALGCARATEIVVNAADIPPFCHEQDGEQTGIAIDLLREVGKATGIVFKIRFLPWKRAQAETQSGVGQLIIPLTRTPEREKYYQWIGPIATYHFIIATHGSHSPPRAVADARTMSIGVLRGNPMETQLPAMGFVKVHPGYTEDALARQLLSDRLEGWVVADLVAPDVFRKAGGDPAQLHFGPKIGEPMSVQLAASLLFPEKERQRIAEELNRLVASGEAERIINRYRLSSH